MSHCHDHTLVQDKTRERNFLFPFGANRYTKLHEGILLFPNGFSGGGWGSFKKVNDRAYLLLSFHKTCRKHKQINENSDACENEPHLSACLQFLFWFRNR